MSDGSGDKPGAVSLGTVGDLCRDVDVSSALMANDVFNVTHSIRAVSRSVRLAVAAGQPGLTLPGGVAALAEEVARLQALLLGLRRSLVEQQDHISGLITRCDGARQQLDSAGETLRLLQSAAAP